MEVTSVGLDLAKHTFQFTPSTRRAWCDLPWIPWTPGGNL
jgi:hypothetical protein